MSDLPADWFLLLLRLLFVFLLYFFLYQLFRVQLRQLVTAAIQPNAKATDIPAAPLKLIMTSQEVEDLPAGSTFVLQPMTTVGRHPDSTLCVADPSTSSAHAEIRLNGDVWWIADVNSTNGTFVNGAKVIRPVRIHSGDVVQFGRVQMEVVR